MKNFIVYNEQGQILRTGTCQNSNFYLQAGDDEWVMEGVADDVAQKIVNAGVAGKVVDKAPGEMKIDSPTPENQRPAMVTNEQWQAVLKRLDELENKA